MLKILRASEDNIHQIVTIGNIAVFAAHRGSLPDEALQEYLTKNYNTRSIGDEIKNTANIYHIIFYNGTAVGFSKICLNSKHANIRDENVTKLDRIYVLPEYHGLRLGIQLLNHNNALAKENNQTGMWLFTWVGNEKAINFYTKVGFTIIGSHQFQVTKEHYNLNHHMLLSLV
jgi:diamine N-acetyltransferase